MRPAVMLATKRSAGVAPEVNLRNSLHTGDKARKRGIHCGFETQERRYQKSKTGVSAVPQKLKFQFLKKSSLTWFTLFCIVHSIPNPWFTTTSLRSSIYFQVSIVTLICCPATNRITIIDSGSSAVIHHMSIRQVTKGCTGSWNWKYYYDWI